MKYALIHGQRQEAQPGLSGECPGCGLPVDSKCGKIRIWYWAHRRGRICDHWWEPETKWHRIWKNFFPKEHQEVRHISANGEIHIADVKIPNGWVIEFQHSFIKPNERLAREAFYSKLVWVVNGLRRKKDQQKFFNSMNNGMRISEKPVVRSVFPDGCALFRDWSDSRVPVFFDFGELNRVWCLLPSSPDGRIYIAEFSRAVFLHMYQNGETDGFEKFLQDFISLVLERNRVMASNK